MSYAQLESGYARFREMLVSTPGEFLAPEGEQSPVALWIGCVDSRVIPEQILDARPGQLLVHRNIANIVPPYGVASDDVGAVIELAVLRLRVREIVICGHTECAGIQALQASVDLAREPHLARWIEWARAAQGRVQSGRIPAEQQYLETIRANVVLQRGNLETYPCVREAVRAGELALRTWLYDLRTGVLEEYREPSGPWYPVLAGPPQATVIDLVDNSQDGVQNLGGTGAKIG